MRGVAAAAEPAEGNASTLPDAGTPPIADERWSVHFQSTVATQYHPAFAAKYSGRNSLNPEAESATATVSTGTLDLGLWRGAEAIFDAELAGGFGLSRTLGVAAFPSGLAFTSR